MARGKYIPQLKDELITRLYHVAQKFQWPISRMLNYIVATALEELEKVNDPSEWEVAIPVRPEQGGVERATRQRHCLNSKP